MQHDPTKWIISIGFSTVLILMLLVTYLSLTQMDENIDQMSHLIEETYAKNTSTHLMRDSIFQRGEILDAMYLTKDYFDRDVLWLEFNAMAGRYIKARNVLKARNLSPAEHSILQRLKPLITRAELVNNEAAEAMLSTASEEEVRKKVTIALANRKSVLLILSELTDIQDKLAMNTLQDSMRYHDSSRSVIIYLTLTTFFIGVLIALLVIRQSSSKNIEIQHQASHDDLTGLPNRKEFENNLLHVFLDSKTNDSEHALCYMDLDHFKIINDTCGHDAGDRLLISLTKIIKEKIRGHDLLGRLGGDEFGLILKNCSLSKALEITQGLIAIVKKYEFKSGDRVFHVGVSIGVVAINKRTKNIAAAMSDADVACYAAKDMGRGRVHVHELHDDQMSTIQKELYWVADIQSSIQDNRFKLFTQAITPVDPDEAVSMYEVLLRLKDDDNNMVSPGEYIPAAERFGLMKDVDLWVIKNALNYSKLLNSNANAPRIKLFINLSANSLSDNKVCDYIINVLDELSLPKGCICFEITETAAIKNITQANKMITELKSKNIEFALDDFGSGMSSFGYLKTLDVDYLKIDGRFVVNMAENKIDYAMVAAMNEIGSVMNIKTIAEHVEDSLTFEKLKELGIHYAQGYYFSMPRPIDDLLKSVNANKR